MLFLQAMAVVSCCPGRQFEADLIAERQKGFVEGEAHEVIDARLPQGHGTAFGARGTESAGIERRHEGLHHPAEQLRRGQRRRLDGAAVVER